MSGGNHYEALGLSRTADAEQIKAAHKLAVRRYHPDTGSSEKGKFLAAQEAFEILSDDRARALYDAELSLSESRREDRSTESRESNRAETNTWPQSTEPTFSEEEIARMAARMAARARSQSNVTYRPSYDYESRVREGSNSKELSSGLLAAAIAAVVMAANWLVTFVKPLGLLARNSTDQWLSQADTLGGWLPFSLESHVWLMVINIAAPVVVALGFALHKWPWRSTAMSAVTWLAVLALCLASLPGVVAGALVAAAVAMVFVVFAAIFLN